MGRHLFVVLTNSVEGEEAEFNTWYDRHLDDVLKVAGVVSGQRFALSPQQRGAPPYPYGYLALYEIETDDLQGMIDILNERLGTPVMPVSPALNPERLSLLFQPLGDARSA